LDGNLNLINASPRTLKRFLFVTRAGVERQKQFPWLILNLYGVLTFKGAAEIALEESGLPWTVLRPSRLVDGPYTSYDLNTLLKATSEAQGLKGVTLVEGDVLKGQASRVAVAEACVQALNCAETEGWRPWGRSRGSPGQRRRRGRPCFGRRRRGLSMD